MEYSPDSPVVNDYNYLVPQSSLPDLLQTIFNRFEEFDDEQFRRPLVYVMYSDVDWTILTSGRQVRMVKKRKISLDMDDNYDTIAREE